MKDLSEKNKLRSVTTDRALDQLVEYIKLFRQQLDLMAELYQEMPSLIDAEHDSIRSGNFGAVRNATAAKISVCDEIAECHGLLVNHSRELPDLSARLTGVRCESPATLSECLAGMVDLADYVSAQGESSVAKTLTRDMLEKLLAGCTTSLESFLDKAESVKSRIEANRHVLEKMVINYQDSYRFWMELASEAQSSYDAKGVQRSSGVASGLCVKA